MAILYPENVTDLGNGEEYFSEDFDRVHCRHGFYIGYPGGADHMCPACEMGWDTLYTYHRLHLGIEFTPGEGFTDCGTWSRISDIQALLRLAWGKEPRLQTRIEVEEVKDWGPA